MDSNLRCPYCGEPVDDAPAGATVSCSACKKSFPRASAHDTLPSDPAAVGDPGETLPVSDNPSNLTQAFQARKVGPYVLGSILGKGGMGAVFRARDTRLNREVAFKIMRGASTASDEARRRFQQEAVTSAKLKHPNIVSIHDVGETPDGECFFVMDVVEGQTLDLWLSQKGLTVTQKVQTLEKIVRAVSHAHGQGIIHRDLKPGNVVVDAESGEPKVMDFGLARVLESASSLTESGDIVGTPTYMSPEQAEGRVRDIDERSDVYSLGAILYEMLVGKPPFEAGTIAALVAKVAHEEPVPPRKANPKIDRDLETICLKCMEKDQERRYRTAAALAEDLHRYILGDSISARPASLLYRASKWCARHKTALSAGVMVALLFVPALVLLGSRQRMLEEERGEVAEELHRTEAQKLEAESALKEKEALLKQAATKQRGVWNLVFGDDFERAEPGPDWVVSTTKDWATSPASVRIRDGHLEFDCSADLPAFLLYRKPFARDLRMTFDAWTSEDTPYDVLGILYGQAAKPQSGYVAGIGMKRNTLAAIDRRFKTAVSTPFSAKPGQRHRIELEKRRNKISLNVDGNPLLAFDDPNPAEIIGDRIGFSTWGPCKVRIDNLKVFEYVPGLSSSPLEFAAKYFQTERYEVAAEEYVEIARAYAGKPESVEAEYHLAMCHLRMEQYDEARKEFDEFVARHPEHTLTPPAHFQLILCALGQARLEEAGEMKSRLGAEYPGHEVLLNLRDIRTDDLAFQAEILREMKLPKASLSLIREGLKSPRAKWDVEYRLKLQIGEMFSLIPLNDTKGAMDLLASLGDGSQARYGTLVQFWKQHLPAFIEEARKRGMTPIEFQQAKDAEADKVLSTAIDKTDPDGLTPVLDATVPGILRTVRRNYPLSRQQCAISLVAEAKFFANRNPPEAIRAFTQLIDEYPEQTRLIGGQSYEYITALNRLGRFDEIVKVVDVLIENPAIPGWSSAGLLTLKGRALANLGRFEEGMECTLSVLKAVPDDDNRCITALGRSSGICRTNGFEPKRCRDIADQLIRKYDRDGVKPAHRLMARDFAHDNFMRSFFDEGDYEKSIEYADKILSEQRRKEDRGSAWVPEGASRLKSRALTRLGRIEESSKVSPYYDDKKSSFDWLQNKALISLELKDPRQAQSALAEAERLQSGLDLINAQHAEYLAVAQIHQGQWQNALDTCQAGIRKHNAEPLPNLFCLLSLCTARAKNQPLRCDFEAIRGFGDGHRIEGAPFAAQGGVLKVPQFPKAGIWGPLIFEQYNLVRVGLLRTNHTFSGIRMKARTLRGKIGGFRVGVIAKDWQPELQKSAEAVVGELGEEWRALDLPVSHFSLPDGSKLDPRWQIYVIYIAQSNPRQDVLIDDLEVLESQE